MNKKDYIISQLIEHYKDEQKVILLESQMLDHPASNVTYFATCAATWIKSSGFKTEIFDGKEIVESHGNPWDELVAYKNKSQKWLFGYLGYELKNSLENIESINDALIEVPDLFFFEPSILLEINHAGEITALKGTVPKQLPKVIDKAFNANLKSGISKTNYIDKIERAQEQISEGEYYEINLSHALEFDFEGDAWALYQKMKEVGPVPFAGFMKLDELRVSCSSPERFLSRTGKRICTQPIKGTIKRDSKNEEEAIQELLNSEKERAENLMIVDLVRNDLSRIATKGSVSVSKLFEVQTFKTVHQLVSTVICEVEDKSDSIEILKACFPMGSMTGAPKIATMQAIDELENYQRGIYSGALGYIKPNDDFDFNVVIRTALIQNGKLFYPVGGAITSDSIPENEWKETFVKARALTEALK
ncbi:MAG: aminodeoxychorismate synthase component I [Balneolaceae bacterium]